MITLVDDLSTKWCVDDGATGVFHWGRRAWMTRWWGGVGDSTSSDKSQLERARSQRQGLQPAERVGAAEP